MLNIETIVVTEDCRRFTSMSPRTAYMYCKNNNGTIFFRCKESKIEEKMVFIGGRIVDIRVKHNRKVINDSEDWDVCAYMVEHPDYEEFHDFIQDSLFPRY